MSGTSERPINGKIGVFLAGIQQLFPLLTILALIGGVMGFAVVSPNSRFDEINTRLNRLESKFETSQEKQEEELENLRLMTDAIVRAKCVQLSHKEIQLAGLPCGLR